MTVNYKDSAVNRLRTYLWAIMQEDGILNKDDYIADGFDQPLVPIIPVQEIPEFNNLVGDKTYIVYSFETEEYGDDWWICRDNITFSIISRDYSKSIEIINYLIDVFRRMDESARDINNYLTDAIKFKFFSTYINSVQSPAPTEEEGGRMISEVSVAVKYSRYLDSNGRFQ